MFLYYNHPSGCIEVNLPYVISIIFFSAQLTLFDTSFLKRVPLVSLDFFIVMAPLPFFAEFRDGSYGLNTQNALPWNTHNALVDALLRLDYRPTEGH